MSSDYDYDDSNNSQISNEDDSYDGEMEEEEKFDNKESVITGNINLYSCQTIWSYEVQIINDIKYLAKSLGLQFGQALYIMNKNQYSLKQAEQNGLIAYQHEIIPEDDEFKNNQECLICFEDSKKLFSTGCGHNFCDSCYKDYIQQIFVQDGQNCILKQCPQDGCNLILNDETFEKYLNQKQYKSYISFIINDSLMMSPYALPCRAQNCNNILQIHAQNQNNHNFNNQLNVECECGENFCSTCNYQGHRPVSCEKLKQWKALFKGENSEGLNDAWISLNSKKCPKCKVDIEKNQGCMHMTCKKCNHEFCWICLQDYRKHGTCNRYQENEDKAKFDDKKKMLEKYNFYTERFVQHEKGIKLTKKKAQENMLKFKQFQNLLTKYQIPQEDDSFLKFATNLILNCRRAIAYSYVIGYYIDEQKRQFFEFQQGNLEQNLEKLDKMVEDMNIKDFIDQSNQFLNPTKTKQFLQFKQDLKKRSIDLASYFNKMLTDFENDLPECKVSQKQQQYSLNYKQQQQKPTNTKQQKFFSKKNSYQNQNAQQNINQNSQTQQYQEPQQNQLTEQQQLELALKLSKQDIDKEKWICVFCSTYNIPVNIVCESCFKERAS